ncbi:MAG TPA: ABC transporter transmembrane domain-containing protein [Verrucomicrobiae bacterium]|nr:ABC transporter transmembrane domain-containing protein [Verrucomicrobiae bacterium]
MKRLIQEVWPQYRRLLKHVEPYRGRLAGGIVFNALYGASNAAVLFVIRGVWKSVFENRGLSLRQIIGVAALLPAAILGRGLCDFIGTYQMNWVGLRAITDLRVRMFRHLQELSLDFYAGSRAGELISRVTNDAGLVQNAISNVIEDVIRQPFTLLFVMATLLYTEWKLTLAGLILLPICLAPILVYGRRTRKASRAAQEHQGSLLSVLHEAITGLRVIKAFNMEQRETDDFTALCWKFFRQRMRVVAAKAISTPLIEMVAGVGGMLVFVYAYQAEIASGQLVVVATGLWMLYDPVKRLSRVHLQIQESLSAAERIFQLLDQQPSVSELPTAKTLPRFNRSIRFENVTFNYERPVDGLDSAVLDDINLEVPASSLMAIVGASGSGKTTLFNLAARFYDPTSGAVKFDGVDIRTVTFTSLRAQIGLVTQETFLFNDTVANNIAYGKPGASREEIVNAAVRAHAHDFIQQMPQQYDTLVGDLGVKLSGGQRQRLAIARAILKNPPILLLDEATSALDTESERVVQAALDDLMWGSTKRQLTMLVIAHRLSTVQHADCIIVLDKGRIVERGTHEELVKREGVYKRLYEMQFNV